ncbi:MAG TPA: ABC transporter substrate-binding protein [Actinomycetes bacterium]
MTRSTRRRAASLIGSAAAASLLLAACGGGSSGGGAASAAATLTGDCAAFQPYAGHSGTTVTINASIISPESDAYIASWKKFEQCTGITISYEGSNDFESQLNIKVQGGTAPDLAFIPQPSLLAKMVATGKVVKAPDAVAKNVDANWNKDWKNFGTVNGTFYAAPMSGNVKSLVWYSPKAFAAKGYTVPTTWDDMMKLSDTIAATGAKPWCGGIGSGTATGWPATDWLEEIVMRQSGPDVYTKWITHDVKFNSPEIKKAMDTLDSWMRNPKYVNGGYGDVKTIATTTFQKAGIPILSGKCWMLQQASFYAAQWPSGTTVGPDGAVNAFYLPAMGTQFGKPVEGGGEFVTAFSDRPEVQAVQTYLSTVDWINGKVKLGNWATANKAIDPANYQQPIFKLTWTLLTDPQATFQFDASDLMPAAVGAGEFWKQMTAWFGANKSTDSVLQSIDAAWPTQ